MLRMLRRVFLEQFADLGAGKVVAPYVHGDQGSSEAAYAAAAISPEFARLCDEGKIENYSSDAVSELFANVVTALNGKNEEWLYVVRHVRLAREIFF